MEEQILVTLINRMGKQGKIILGLVLMLGILVSSCSAGEASIAPINPITSENPSMTANPTPSGTTATGSVATSSLPQGKLGSLSVTFDKTSVNPGESFMVNVIITSNSATRGATVGLKFDPSAMLIESVEGISEGSFYKDYAKTQEIDTIVFPAPVIDNVNGTAADVGVAVMGETKNALAGKADPGLTGTGILLSYKMIAKANVNKLAQVSITNPVVTDQKGNSLDIKNFAINNGVIKIGTP